jgi:hypothetical protein
MGDVESGSSHEGGLADDAVSTSTGDTQASGAPATVLPESSKPESVATPRAKRQRAKRPTAAKKPVSEDTSGRPDLTKVAERRAASRNKRIKRTKEEE